MAPRGSQEKTEAELLQEILGLLGESMAAPDADIPFLQQIQQAIVQHIGQKKQAVQQQVAAAATMGGAGGGPSSAGMGPPPAPNQSSLPGRAGPPGLSTLTDPSEIQRMLAGSGQTG